MLNTKKYVAHAYLVNILFILQIDINYLLDYLILTIY